MEAASKVAGMASTEVLKEPRGFIKFIQIAIAIFAFATATGYYGSTSFTVECPAMPVQHKTIKFSYPYQLDTTELKTNTCANVSATMTTENPMKSITVYGDYSTASEFYVFIGVTAFLYSLGILLFYVFADNIYQNMEIVPTIDFVVTAVYALLWLVSSSAWADAVSKIKRYTDPSDYFNSNQICECVKEVVESCPKAECEIKDSGNYATINVSIIFGFLCMLVWIGNLWFLYKETKWFKASHPNTAASGFQSSEFDGGVTNNEI